jgi:hypothetical protein
MRPSTVRKLAIIVSRFPEGSGLPQSLALEVAPALAYQGHRPPSASIKERLALPHAFLLRPAPAPGGKLAAGARFTFADKSDLRCDDELWITL